MGIYLKEIANKKKKFTFPSMPDGEIDIRMQTAYQEYNFVRKGKQSFPSGMDKQPIKWEGYFWGKSRKKAGLSSAKWISPGTCVKKLKKWETDGTPLNLIISESGINMDVTIASFNPKPFGGYGDYSYSIEFLAWHDLKIYTTGETGIKKQSKKKKKTSRTNNKKATPSTGAASSRRTYCIVPGDTLCGISRKHYGSEGKWQSIYQSNKETLEQSAKKHGYSGSDNGWWIFPGTVLSLP